LGLPTTEAPQRSPFLPFEVNIIVDNEATKAAPIVIESNPTWANLFGRIERHAYMGAYFSDHTMLKAGSMHQANGGYLVLNAKDTLINPGVWDGLKRAIRDREVRLEDPQSSRPRSPQASGPYPMERQGNRTGMRRSTGCSPPMTRRHWEFR
jgi:predicted ATP-dependent protease